MSFQTNQRPMRILNASKLARSCTSSPCQANQLQFHQLKSPTSTTAFHQSRGVLMMTMDPWWISFPLSIIYYKTKTPSTQQALMKPRQFRFLSKRPGRHRWKRNGSGRSKNPCPWMILGWNFIWRISLQREQKGIDTTAPNKHGS